jgi:hypothetical protein
MNLVSVLAVVLAVPLVASGQTTAASEAELTTLTPPAETSSMETSSMETSSMEESHVRGKNAAGDDDDDDDDDDGDPCKKNPCGNGICKLDSENRLAATWS